jgi:hypothetical protein
MATVPEEYVTENRYSVVLFLWAKGLSAKDIHKEMFPVYGGKCLSLKTVQPWFANISLTTGGRNEGTEIAETAVKRLSCCGFRRVWN